MNFLLQYAQWDRSYLWNKCWESQIKSKTGTKWILWSVTNCCAFVRDTWVACRMVAVQTMKSLVTSDFFFMFEFWIVYSWQSTSDRSSTYPASSPKSGHFEIKIQVYLKKQQQNWRHTQWLLVSSLKYQHVCFAMITLLLWQSHVEPAKLRHSLTKQLCVNVKDRRGCDKCSV